MRRPAYPRASAGRRCLGMLMVCLSLAACAGPYYPDGYSGAPVTAARSGSPPGYYIVKPGDTLYSIAWQYGLDYRQLAQWNGIGPSYLIYAGQRLRVAPPPAPPSAPARPSGTVTAPAPGLARNNPVIERPYGYSPTPSRGTPKRRYEPAAPPPRPVPRSVRVAPAPRRVAHHEIRWRWPTYGTVVHGYDPDAPGRKGVDIAGRVGQFINAAASGRVVYSGGGLVGYGRIIIIKHSRAYLSAYAFNEKLFVKEGQEVHAGQLIAEMGRNGNGRPMLHFEIRRNGKPVDPLRYLPKR
ncbi:MAG: peptidoglycan DD-metalloendopeptidase family protein [Gammaproteobacteria bacterium]|nr:peptidoglycan DD-metalloendopeptidase family protein [Gammaproteobacteria bacterium]